MTERQVALGGVAENQAAGLLQAEGAMVEGTGQDVANAVPKFETKKYSSFKAEYGIVGDDLVVHFYLPEGFDITSMGTQQQKLWSDWWGGDFPNVMSRVAQEYFEVEYPRVVAKYTEEVASWWFCARGFASSFDPHRLLETFLEKMDAALPRPS